MWQAAEDRYEKISIKQSPRQPTRATNCQKTVLQNVPPRLTGRAVQGYLPSNGEVAERLNAPVLKTGKGASPSWVRIPPSPPLPMTDCLWHLDGKVKSRLISPTG